MLIKEQVIKKIEQAFSDKKLFFQDITQPKALQGFIYHFEDENENPCDFLVDSTGIILFGKYEQEKDRITADFTNTETSKVLTKLYAINPTKKGQILVIDAFITHIDIEFKKWASEDNQEMLDVCYKLTEETYDLKDKCLAQLS